MNLRNRIIIEDYRKNRADFLQLGDLVHEKLQQMVKAAGMQVLGIEHRVKSESSLAGKLERSGDWYQDFSDLTDILGERVICFFNDEVDAVGKMVEDAFYIYRDLSSDKRALIKEDSFGYLSLHYICALPENAGYPENLCGKKFEIQIRTVLQHTWAAINHDLGYKSEFGVPREYARELSRIAGLLEIADDEFMRVRDGMNKYAADIKLRIEENRADDVALNTISLTEYLARNKKMLELINKIASISGAEVRTIDCESYLIQLKWFGVNTLGDLQSMTERNFELAFQLAQKSLSASDIDILSSVAGLRFVCRAELLSGGYTQEQAADFLKISTGNAERAERLAKRLFQQYRRITEKKA